MFKVTFTEDKKSLHLVYKETIFEYNATVSDFQKGQKPEKCLTDNKCRDLICKNYQTSTIKKMSGDKIKAQIILFDETYFELILTMQKEEGYDDKDPYEIVDKFRVFDWTDYAELKSLPEWRYIEAGLFPDSHIRNLKSSNYYYYDDNSNTHKNSNTDKPYRYFISSQFDEKSPEKFNETLSLIYDTSFGIGEKVISHLVLSVYDYNNTMKGEPDKYLKNFSVGNVLLWHKNKRNYTIDITFCKYLDLLVKGWLIYNESLVKNNDHKLYIEIDIKTNYIDICFKRLRQVEQLSFIGLIPYQGRDFITQNNNIKEIPVQILPKNSITSLKVSLHDVIIHNMKYRTD